MNLLRYAASKFEVPLTHLVHRTRNEVSVVDTYKLKKITFSDRQLVGTYGDEDYDYDFDIVIRGIA
jgi:hypothetical protein